MRKELNWLGIVVFLIVIGLCAEWKRRALNETGGPLNNSVGLEQAFNSAGDDPTEMAQGFSSEPGPGKAQAENSDKETEAQESQNHQLQSLRRPNPATGAKASSDTFHDPRYPNRLSNSALSVSELSRSESGILLRNALIDTKSNRNLNIPEHLKSTADTRSFLVQSKSKIDRSFRDELEGLGAEVVAYVPNNAYLIQVNEDQFTGIDTFKLSPSVQAAVPFEPYFKLDTDLLDIAVREAPLPDHSFLNLTLFPSAQEPDWEQFGFRPLGRSKSPFGNNVTLEWTGNGNQDWTELARMEATQAIEFYYPRTFANDLARVRLGVAPTALAMALTSARGPANKLVPLS